MITMVDFFNVGWMLSVIFMGTMIIAAGAVSLIMTAPRLVSCIILAIVSYPLINGFMQ